MSGSWTLEIRDSKEKIQISGDKAFIDDLEMKIKKLDKDGKMTVAQVLKKLKLEVRNDS